MAKRKSTSAAAPESTSSASAEYTVLARRYRPQQFGDLVGQDAVAQALLNALQSGRVAHAYLFTGARGVGKTSTARILAKALNCPNGAVGKPCDQCEICKAIASGEDTDVLEIDGASNRGIDEIRELRQNVQYRPSRSRYKVYIIDEVHMLTKEAFNALLKTLEEPPPHVKFIFATTEVQKVPVTILSRCQRFDFGGISIDGITTRLKEIVKAEGMNADDEALETVARRAGGSMRDAQSLLDQLLAFSGKTLTVESVHQLLGTAHEERVAAIAGAVLAKDPKQVLEIVNQIANQGQQLGELLDQLIDYWRDLMVVNSAGIAGQAVSVSSARRSLLEQHAKRASLDTILAGMDVLVTAKTRMRHSSHVRAILEMALVRLSQLEDLLPIAQIAQWIATEGPTPTSAPPRMTPNQAAPPSAGAEKKKLIRDGDSSARPAGVSLNDENLPSIWQQVIQESGFALQADLRRISNVAISGPNTLVFRINRRYNSSSGAFHDAAKLAKVQELLERIVGQPCAISIEWTDDAAEPKGSPKTPAAAAMGQQRQARVELMKIPFVKNVVDVLNAQIVRADEGFGATAKADLADADEVPQSSDEQDETAT